MLTKTEFDLEVLGSNPDAITRFELEILGSNSSESITLDTGGHPFVWAVRDTLTWGQLGVKAFMILSQKPKIDPKIFGRPLLQN